MNLYDTPADVVRKALRGLEIAPSQAAAKAGIPDAELHAFLADRFAEATARTLAEALGLDPEALASLPDYRPALPPCPGLTQLALPFEDEEVNAWLLEKDGTVLVIDAGFGPDDLAAALDARGIDRCHLLLTHGHRDHVGGVAGVGDRLESLHAPETLRGATLVHPGDTFRIGSFDIAVGDLRGHHPDAVGYRIDGLELPLLAVGDAVFAGSVGGCFSRSAYDDARRTIRESVLTQPSETILLTGHGPGTTLAQELERNPFLGRGACHAPLVRRSLGEGG